MKTFPLVNLRSWSIKSQLGLVCAFVAFITFFAIARFVDWNLHASLSREENDFVFSRFHNLRAIISAQPDYLDVIAKDITWEAENVPNPEYFLRLIDEEGRVLTETKGMSKIIPPKAVPTPPTSLRGSMKDKVVHASNNRYYLLKSDTVATDGGDKITIQIGLDVTSEENIDAENHLKINVLLFVGVILFTGVFVKLINLVLRPLTDMKKFADEVTEQQIASRIDSQNLPAELRSFAEALNSMLGRLEEVFKRLSGCASNLAHELRTPITNMVGEIEVALSQRRTEDEYRHVLQSADEECARLNRLIDVLVFLARSENPAATVQRSLFDPVAEIRNVYTFFGPLAEEKQAILTCGGVTQLNADLVLFRRVVMNLVSNSLYYSPVGVHVDITVSSRRDGSTEVVVSDTGFGIPEADLVRIADRFYRSDDTRPLNPEGMGLGLSIVQAVMGLHGGDVRFASTFGRGTTVTLCFPPGNPPPRPLEALCMF